MFRGIKSLFSNIADRVNEFFDFCRALPKNLKGNTLETISRLLLYAIVLLVCITAIVLFVFFIVDGTYATQVAQIRGTADIYDRQGNVINDPGFFERLGAAFTTGRTSDYFNNAGLIILLVLFGCSLITIHLTYIADEKIKSTKSGAVVLFSFLCILGYVIPLIASIAIAIWPVLKGLIVFGSVGMDEVQYLVSQGDRGAMAVMSIHENYQTTYGIILLSYAGALIAVLVISSIFLSRSNPWIELIGKWWFALLLSFAILPVSMLLLKNIIPLAVSGAIVVIIGVGIFLANKFIDSSPGSSSSYVSLSGFSADIDNQAAGSKYRVAVKLSSYSGSKTYEGTYIVRAADESCAKRKAEELLRKELIQSKKLSVFGERFVSANYLKVEKL